jgi:hypothetical protein
MESIIDPLLLQELRVGSDLDQPLIRQGHDLIAFLDGAQPVGDEQVIPVRRPYLLPVRHDRSPVQQAVGYNLFAHPEIVMVAFERVPFAAVEGDPGG